MLKQRVINLLNKLLPKKLFILLKMRPRLKVVDIYTARKIDWLWRNIFRGINSRGNDTSVLRKQAHILEKGLQRPDRRSGHSSEISGYVESLIEQTSKSDTSLWASDVLRLYRELQSGVDISEDIDVELKASDMVPDDLINLIKSRRSHRYFSTKDISKQLLEQLIETINWCANSCNRQTAKVYVVTDNELIKKSMSLNGGATCMNTPPVFISFVSDTRSYILPVEREAAFIDVSLGAQNFMLLAQSHGIGTCVLNWTHATALEEKTLRELLGIPEHELIIFNMLVGYPKKNIKPSARKSVDETVKYVEKK